MNADLLGLVRCPECRGPLAARGDPIGLGCDPCGASYPVVRGIPRLGGEAYVASFGRQWNRYDVARPEEDEATFRVKTGLDPRALAGRLAHRIQLTTDGNRVYINAVEDAFGTEIDYAMLVKVYGPEAGGETRYSPPVVIGAYPAVVTGNPDQAHISTSYIERQNLTMRMQMRRFTRLTNAFSKKAENHTAAVSLHFMHYNFARIHTTLRVTPAMEAGVTDHVWSLAEIVGLLDASPAGPSN